MNWQAVEHVATNPDKQWYLTICQVGNILGCNRHTAAQILKDHSVPWYEVGKSKKYFLPEVVEAIEKRKWASGAG